MRSITADDLPEDIAAHAEAQVASGRFANIEYVIRAGVEALDESDDPTGTAEWIAYARQEFLNGIGEIERGKYITGTPQEIMAGIRTRVAKHLD